ncbi:hypothetical protein A5747_13410 [Mycobacterium sp. IS-836]|uniref:hypothetical protein n=1 Tax=Mycobacterium sp. IS-836 TaxID=1834160 RepID=UPI00096D876A|nr:hypothetical protein [Mycobacterium sp. IS-836]OMC55385.1 hypothetical protein A5747_13410 [Mycobacterium sp. IS-836]
MSTKSARDLRAGDVVQVNAQTAWRITEITRLTDKAISYNATYVQCDWSPARIGTTVTYRHRLGTQVVVR